MKNILIFGLAGVLVLLIAFALPGMQRMEPVYVYAANGVVYYTNFTEPPREVAKISARFPDGRSLSYFGLSSDGSLFFVGPEPNTTIVKRLDLRKGSEEIIAEAEAGRFIFDIIVSDDGKWLAYEERNDCGSPENPPECITDFVLVNVKTKEKTVFAGQRFPRGGLPEEFDSLVRFCADGNRIALSASKNIYKKSTERAPIVSTSLSFWDISKKVPSESFLVTNYHASSALDFEEVLLDFDRLSPDCESYITYIQENPDNNKEIVTHKVVDRRTGVATPLYELPKDGIPLLSSFRFGVSGEQVIAKQWEKRDLSGASRYRPQMFGVALIDSNNPRTLTVYPNEMVSLKDGVHVHYIPGAPPGFSDAMTLAPDGSRLVYPVYEPTLSLTGIATFDVATKRVEPVRKDSISLEVKDRAAQCLGIERASRVKGTEANLSLCQDGWREEFEEAYQKGADRVIPIGWTSI